MSSRNAPQRQTNTLHLRPPVATDGPALHALVRACKPLDENSLYCNLLHCSHFAGTSCAAEIDSDLVGFVSGYLLPDQSDTFFLWQVAVAEAGRSQGLAKRMTLHILGRPALSDVRFLHTTITADNAASWALFRSIARALDAPWQSTPHFDRDAHFAGAHASEHLMCIGPFHSQNSSSKYP